MKYLKKIIQIALLSIFFLYTTSIRANLNTPEYLEDFQIISSIKPVQLLVQSVLGDVAKSQLLIYERNDIHTHKITASELRLLNKMDIVFYIHPHLEKSLASALASLGDVHSYFLFNPEAKSQDYFFTNLIQASGYLKEQIKALEAESKHDDHNEMNNSDSDHHQDEHHDHNHGFVDYHIWLDPIYTKVMIDEIERKLSEKFPTYQLTFKKNAADTKDKISKIDNKIKELFKEMKSQSFLVYHDAYQYFTRHYQIFGAETISDHSGNLSASRMFKIQDFIQEANIHCIFMENQFLKAKRIIDTIIDKQKMDIVMIDPIGSTRSYEDLIFNLAQKFRNCLMK